MQKETSPEQPEPLLQPEVPLTLEMAQPETPPAPPAEETARVEPAPKAEKKRSTLKLSVILSRIMVLLLVAAVAGLGYWAYTLNSQLEETRQQLTTLQEEHANLEKAYATLTDANATLTAGFSQTKADLEKANTDLAEAQKEAKKWKTVSTDLGVKVDQVSKLAEVLYAWNTADEPEDVLDINSLIEKSEDDFLIKLWKELARGRSEEAYDRFINYLIRAIRNGLQ